MDRPITFLAQRLIIDSATVVDDVAVVVANGIVQKIVPAESAPRRGRKIDCGDTLLHPGFVNAHCHLDLSFMQGSLKKGGSFTEWILALIAARRQTTPRTVEAGITSGINRLVATGTTSVGDITSYPGMTARLQKSGVRAVVFHEVMGGFSGSDDSSIMTNLNSRIAATPDSPLAKNAISPHAVYSTSPNIYAAAARKKMVLATHLCETVEETEFARYGTGPFADMKKRLGVYSADAYPGDMPLGVVAKSGALHRALLIHMNHPARGDITKIKKSGATIVYCPRSNFHLGRRHEYPLLSFMRKKIPVALGTDSLASNNDLDMTAEMRAVAKKFPDLPMPKLFDMATVTGAEALRLPKGTGTLHPGAPFDAVSITGPGAKRGDPFRAIMNNHRQVRQVWIGGVSRYRNRG